MHECRLPSARKVGAKRQAVVDYSSFLLWIMRQSRLRGTLLDVRRGCVRRSRKLSFAPSSSGVRSSDADWRAGTHMEGVRSLTRHRLI
jgi:hypothetical protein